MGNYGIFLIMGIAGFKSSSVYEVHHIFGTTKSTRTSVCPKYPCQSRSETVLLVPRSPGWAQETRTRYQTFSCLLIQGPYTIFVWGGVLIIILLKYNGPQNSILIIKAPIFRHREHQEDKFPFSTPRPWALARRCADVTFAFGTYHFGNLTSQKGNAIVRYPQPRQQHSSAFDKDRAGQVDD